MTTSTRSSRSWRYWPGLRRSIRGGRSHLICTRTTSRWYFLSTSWQNPTRAALSKPVKYSPLARPKPGQLRVKIKTPTPTRRAAQLKSTPKASTTTHSSTTTHKWRPTTTRPRKHTQSNPTTTITYPASTTTNPPSPRNNNRTTWAPRRSPSASPSPKIC